MVCADDYVYRVPGSYTFVRCDDCRHIYINPRPADEVLMDCYPGDYGPHVSSPDDQEPAVTDPGRRSLPRRSLLRRSLGKIPLLKPFLFWLGQQHATVIPDLPDREDARLLEVGCAHGGYLSEAAAVGWQVDGIEPDAVAAERARRRGFDVQVGTFSSADVVDQSRDVVAAWMVLEHVPDPVSFLQESIRVLRPGGTLCVSVPNGGGFERHLFGKYWLGYDAPRHLQVFTPSRLRRLLTEVGFVEVRVIHQSSIRYWWGSVAAWAAERWPHAEWPKRWMGYFIDEPPTWLRLVSLVPEKLLAIFRCAGRITVTAKKRSP